MATIEEARGLAQSLVAVANGAGLKTTALITDMDEPLARCAGNALEVAHACEYLKGSLKDRRVTEITLALGAELLVSAGIEGTLDAASARLAGTIASGAAAERFERMVAALGGPTDFLSHHQSHLARAPIIRPVHADGEGVVSSIRTRDLGLAVIELGGGRRVASDRIDHRVGLSALAGKGDRVGSQSPLALIHAAGEASFEKAAALVKNAYSVGAAGGESATVLARITA
jgi:thymidine phosphorylase